MSDETRSSYEQDIDLNLPNSEAEEPARGTDEMHRLVVMLRAERIILETAEYSSDKKFSGAFDTGVGRILHRLTYDAPVCRTSKGAAEALRLVADEIEETAGSFSLPVLMRVLEFVRQQDDLSELGVLLPDTAVAA